MKTILLIIVTLYVRPNCFAQGDTTFFNADWKKCNRNEAKYYRVLTTSGEKTIARDFTMNGLLQMEAEIKSADPFIKEGPCTTYDEQGRKESAGVYKNGNRYGIWTWWLEEGRDSLINEYDDNGFKTRIRPPMTTAKSDSNKVFTIVEHMPEFPGGEQAMLEYISNNVKYPESARKDTLEGKVMVQFVISKTGDVMDAKIVKSVRNDLDEAALKVVKEMPQWKPGFQNNKPVLVSFNLPINFTLREKKGN